MKYPTILTDFPWQQTMVTGFTHPRHKRPNTLPYPTMTLPEIRSLPIPDLADTNCHLWLWTTNQFLPDGFDLMKYWGFKYMIPIHWVKPSGCGAWWIHRTQTLLFGYRGKLQMKSKFHPNVLFASATKHSKKPESSYQLIEKISHEPYLELFARHKQNDKWTCAGDEIDGEDIFTSLQKLILV